MTVGEAKHAPRCPHGGFALPGGACIYDAMHPAVQCQACGRSVCPCGTCRAEHRTSTGHALTFVGGGSSDLN